MSMTTWIVVLIAEDGSISAVGPYSKSRATRRAAIWYGRGFEAQVVPLERETTSVEATS